MIERILQLITQSGKSDYALERLLGFTQGTISNWRRSKNKISTDAIIKLSQYFNVSTDYLLGLSSNPSSANTIKINQIKQAIKEPLASTPYLVAYIDVLETKEQIKKDDGDQFLKKLSTIYTVWQEICKNLNNKISSNIQLKVFSDNLIFVAKYKDEDYYNLSSFFISLINRFQYTLFSEEKILVRGAICDNKLYFDDTFTCGQALIDSYYLESNVAIFPRIIIEKNLYEKIKQINPEKAKDSFDLDFDGQYYLDFLKLSPPSEIKILKRNVEEEIKRLENEKKPERVLQKQYWLLHYINYRANPSYDFVPISPTRPNIPELYTQPAVVSFVEQFHSLMEDQHFIDTAKIYRQLELEIRSALYGELVKWLKNHNIDVDRILGL